jgi:hypothetical protein
VIRRTVTEGVTALPLKKESRPEIKVMVKAMRFALVTSMEETRGSWIVESLHVPTCNTLIFRKE